MSLVSRFIREPILHFLVLGALLYSAALVHARVNDPQEIVISAAIVKRLSDKYAQQFGGPPPPNRLEYLIDRHIQDEALYRQGTKMGLGEQDEIIRRRIIQKMEFLAESERDYSAPTQEQLRKHFLVHAERYRTPNKATFQHLYFSPDRDGNARARARAIAKLQELSASHSSRQYSGDPFPDRLNFVLADREEIARSFGRNEFAEAVFSLPTGKWSGPIQSGYGWHIVRVEAREPPRMPDFESVAEDVMLDWYQDRQIAAKTKALEEIVSQYRIVRAEGTISRMANK